jgi:hypothetical protein
MAQKASMPGDITIDAALGRDNRSVLKVRNKLRIIGRERSSAAHDGQRQNVVVV